VLLTNPNVILNPVRSKGKIIFEYFYPKIILCPMRIVFATNNKYKLKEISSLLGKSFTLLDLKDINMTEDIPEDEPTLEGNALFKARYINKITGMFVFADDIPMINCMSVGFRYILRKGE
jgi:hypothetical protein